MPQQYIPSRGYHSKVSNFPERVYEVHNNQSRIFKLMKALLEIGVGNLENTQTAALTGQQSLSGTMFSELDDFFSFLGISRLPTEQYPFSPGSEPLTLEQWQEVISKDAIFRLRIMKFLQSLTRGGTVEGLEMMAYAACGVPCRILELWTVNSGTTTDFLPEHWRGYKMDKSFLVVPKEKIDWQQKAAILHLVDLLKPVDSVCAVLSDPNMLKGYDSVAIKWTAASNHYYTISKIIVKNDTQLDTSTGLVPTALGTEAPTYALMDTTDLEWDLNAEVNAVRATVESPFYTLDFGELVGNINDTVETITVLLTNLVLEPNSPVFNIKIDDEIMTVIDRETTGNDNEVTYVVLRGEEMTTAASHTGGAIIGTNAVDLQPLTVVEGGITTEWLNIPPMPENVSTDAYGNIVPQWESEEDYIKWFKNKVSAMGAEFNGNQYRLPVQYSTPSGDEFTADDALADPDKDITITFLPTS